ncbi:hypothetical protein GJ496_004309 [Pomphorhynchus laevis]|nr:hypothetical protein GJ496_004309 [Pomphorhynchus laevis]
MFDIFDGAHTSRHVQDYSGASRVQTRDELLNTIVKCRIQRMQERQYSESCIKIQRWYRMMQSNKALRMLAETALHTMPLNTAGLADLNKFYRVVFLTKCYISSSSNPLFLSCLLNHIISVLQNLSSVEISNDSRAIIRAIARDVQQICISCVFNAKSCYFQVLRILNCLWSANFIDASEYSYSFMFFYSHVDKYYECVRSLAESLTLDQSQANSSNNIIMFNLSKVIIAPLQLNDIKSMTNIRITIMRSFIQKMVCKSSESSKLIRVLVDCFSSSEFPYHVFYSNIDRNDSKTISSDILMVPLSKALKTHGPDCLLNWKSTNFVSLFSLLSSSIKFGCPCSFANHCPDIFDILSNLIEKYYAVDKYGLQIQQTSTDNYVDSRENYKHRCSVVRDICFCLYKINELLKPPQGMNGIIPTEINFLADCWACIQSTVIGKCPIWDMKLQSLREAIDNVYPTMVVFHTILSDQSSLSFDCQSQGDQQEIASLFRQVVFTTVHVNIFMLKLLYSSMTAVKLDRLLPSAKRPVINQSDRIKFHMLYKASVDILNDIANIPGIHEFIPRNQWYTDRIQIDVNQSFDNLLCYLDDVLYEEFITGYEDGRPNVDATNYNMEIVNVLKNTPFIISFNGRKQIARISPASRSATLAFLPLNIDSPRSEKIHRSFIYEDAFNAFHNLPDSNYQRSMRVNMVNEAGAQEAGIDQGGLFKEFIVKLLDAAFQPDRGLFTKSDQAGVYPNPASVEVYPNFYDHYRFIGCMLGKLIFDGLVCSVRLADFFLVQILPSRPERVEFGYLKSYDLSLYKSINKIRCSKDIPELNLDFTTVVLKSDGTTRVVELKPNGSNIDVTESNIDEYVSLLINFKMTEQIRPQIDAFRSGFLGVLGNAALSIFCLEEIHTLISGCWDQINLEDWRMHSKYNRCTDDNVHLIVWFWSIVKGFTNEQRSDLLMFTTSLPRPPISGFEDLDPQFTLELLSDMPERLPYASTCTNTLFIPNYTSEEMFKSKLLQSIESKSGFEQT